MSACNLCGASLGAPIYLSPAARSITSTGHTLERRHAVYLCSGCAHLQTPPLDDLERYYDKDYKILVESEDEDQVYEISKAGPVFRTQHQAKTLQRLLELPYGATVLEFGAGKAATLRHLHAARPDLQVYAFDVSRDYLPFWQRFLPQDRCATYEIPADWEARFDVVCAFFVLEHVAAPKQVVESLRRLLKPAGILYVVVPDVFANWADLLVCEHVSHFHEASLQSLACAGRYAPIKLDRTSHQGALILIAGLGVRGTQAKTSDPEAEHEARKLADYWNSYAERVRSFERKHAGDGPSAIYGAGFYGAYLLNCLKCPERIAYFVDGNPYLQGQQWQGRPVVAPEGLPGDIRTIYAGLNPLRAQAILSTVPGWEGRKHDVFLP